MILWALCSRTELEEQNYCVESVDIKIRLFRKRGAAIAAAKQELAVRYNAVIGQHFVAHPNREEIESELTNCLDSDSSYVMDTGANANIIIFMRKVESE